MKDEVSSADAWTAWDAYLTSRRAIVHSVEVSPTYSAHAQKLVRGFRRGMYTPHIDFHVASIDAWVSSQLGQRGQVPFLDSVILDMPSSQAQIQHVARAMKDDALLIVFTPSVTQIAECVRIIQEKGIALQQDKVLELGEGISNGRVWDVRFAKGRRKVKVTGINRRDGMSIGERLAKLGQAEVEDEAHGDEPEETIEETVEAVEESLQERSPQHDDVGLSATVEENDEEFMVCRPKVGRVTIGGGFVGVWRKTDTLASPSVG